MIIDPANPDYTNTPVSEHRPPYLYRQADPMADPIATVVTPFFDSGEHFRDLARSIFAQSLQQWEWLIVDDGSTDPASLRLLDEVAAEDPRVRVIQQANLGPSAARNRGYREARAPYVVQVDADDLLEPTAFEKWLWLLVSYPEYSVAGSYSIGFSGKQYLWTKGFHQPQDFLASNMVTITSMVRREVHERVGGFDEENRDGLEDWDFWMRCAVAGCWGGTIPEYLDWYRRRARHDDRWANWDGAARERRLRDRLKKRYPQLWRDGMPAPRVREQVSFERIPEEIPCANRLAKEKPRVLMLLPWMTMGGADRFNLDLLRHLVSHGHEVSIATTLHGSNDWAHEFARHTPDIFVLENFLRDCDYPRFIQYLVESRQIDTILVTHSLLGYMLLPFLRSRCPDVTMVDYCHAETPEWLNGGYPRFGVAHQSMLDLHIVSSEHLKRWMVDAGADADKIAVCYTSIDPEIWRPDAEERTEWRRKLRIDPRATVLLYPVRLVDQKQPRVFARTLQLLAEGDAGFVAVVAGSGPERPWLESFVQSKRLTDRVRFSPPIPADRMPGLMAASDILFLPSKLEGIALCLYEAMASGAVVVSAAVGGQRELVTAECGFLLDRDAVEDEAVEYAARLAALIQDPETRRRMATAARQRVCAEFDIETMGSRMVELFADAHGRRVAAGTRHVDRDIGLEWATTALEYCRLHTIVDMLWKSREERLGMHKSWRQRFWRVALAVHRRLPPPFQSLAAKVYRRLIAGKSAAVAQAPGR